MAKGCFAAFLMLAATGCGQLQKADDRICLRPPPLGSSSSANALLTDCVHRWAYRLAAAPGSNREIAEATVAGCLGPLTDAVMEQAGRRGQELRYEQILPERERYALRIATFHVAQARAGHCDIP